MEIKEAIDKLRQIRGWYESGAIPMATANLLGKKYVEIANRYYSKKSREYGIGGKKIPLNVKFFPK